MALFTLTINNYATALDRKNHEVKNIARFLEQAANDIAKNAGSQTSGNILDYNNVVVGNWTFTPQAST
jgi:hypothetical protein